MDSQRVGHDRVHTHTHRTRCVQGKGESHPLDRKIHMIPKAHPKNIFIEIYFVFLFLTPGPSQLEAAMLLQEELEMLQQKCLKEVDIYLLISQLVLDI